MSIPTALMIQAVNNYERCPRGACQTAAALALVKLRERYETWHAPSLPEDECTWAAYAGKHLTFPLARANQMLGRMLGMGGLIKCSHCQAEATSACTCGQPYVPTHRWLRAVAAVEPSALERATAAIEAAPGKSNRALAKEIGVSFETVARARRRLRAQESAGRVSGNVSPESAPC